MLDTPVQGVFLLRGGMSHVADHNRLAKNTNQTKQVVLSGLELEALQLFCFLLCLKKRVNKIEKLLLLGGRGAKEAMQSCKDHITIFRALFLTIIIRVQCVLSKTTFLLLQIHKAT